MVRGQAGRFSIPFLCFDGAQQLTEIAPLLILQALSFKTGVGHLTSYDDLHKEGVNPLTSYDNLHTEGVDPLTSYDDHKAEG
ncbi:hypothetical protein RRG08_046980 [Elysia crispata]|uniref:Uncharacterized protein n=1 Tax=Elysia crispata TaxID=231223 RepID=A0AAE1A9L9_9GAST|nr:hypothetical protein RRG08_046980 [Elysia crispata]